MTDITIRPGQETDMDAVFGLVEELAVFERAADEVKTSIDTYRRDGFGPDKWFHCLVAENAANEIVGIALYYHAYSTWKGRMLFLEDFVVRESYRRKGIGRKLIDALVQVALDQDVALIKWQVLDWNEGAIKMYQGLGGHFDETWIDVKLYRDQLTQWVPGEE